MQLLLNASFVEGTSSSGCWEEAGAVSGGFKAGQSIQGLMIRERSKKFKFSFFCSCFISAFRI